MQSKLVYEREGLRTYVLVYQKGDEFIAGLKSFSQQSRLTSSHFTAIGAFSDAVLGFFDPQDRDYKKIPVQEQVEVLNLLGNITMHDGEHKIHAHTVLGKADASALGGHLFEAHVWPTLEVIVEESPQHLRRRIDIETGLPLLELGTADA